MHRAEARIFLSSRLRIFLKDLISAAPSCHGLKIKRDRKQQFFGRILTDNRKFPTDEIMSAQNINFAFKFLQNGDFFHTRLRIFGRKLFDEKNLSPTFSR